MEDQNNGGAPPKRNPPHRWPKGVSGNPGGRPKGVAARVRQLLEEADDPDAPGDIWAWFDGIRRGKVKGFGARERLDAGKILLERGYGRVAETQIQIQAEASEVEGAAETADAALAELAASLGESPPTPDPEPSGGIDGGSDNVTPLKHSA